MFLNFKSEIINISKGNNGTMEAPTDNSDVLDKAAIDLTKKSEIQENVRQRLELQREFWPLTTFVNGKSVAQLRSEKWKKRKMSQFAENCRLKSLLIEDDRFIIIPASIIEYPRNMRWYNNSLMDSNSINLPPVNILTYMEDINTKRCSELKWKLLMRLTDHTSPKSKREKIKF